LLKFTTRYSETDQINAKQKTIAESEFGDTIKYYSYNNIGPEQRKLKLG
jgi:hypothetical protein